MRSIKIIFFIFSFLLQIAAYGQYRTGSTSQDSLQSEIRQYVSGNDSILKLTPALPEAGSLVKFIYTGQFAGKLMPKFTVYFDKGPWQTLKTWKTTKGFEGSFTIPDSTLSFSIKPGNDLRDVNESLIYLVYKEGKPLPGALAAAAVNYKGLDYNSNFQMAKARVLYRREFNLHPELRGKYLIAYYGSGSWEPDSLVVREIYKTWADSIQIAKNDRFLTPLYDLIQRFSWLSDKEAFKAQLLAKFPQGDVAFADARNDLEKSGALYEKKLAEIELKFRSAFALNGLDQIYSQRSRVELNKGELEKAAAYIGKIRSKYALKQAYMDAANRLLSKKTSLDTAVSFVSKALTLYGFQMQLYTDTPYPPNDKNLKYVKSSVLDLYAQVLYAKGDLTAALQKAEEARFIESSGVLINESYLKYLLETEDYRRAFSVSDSCLKADIISDQIKAVHHLAFSKLEPDQAKYEQHFRHLTDSVNLAYKLPDYSKLNLKSIDFELDGLDGKRFKLSEHKGKTIVLYFFSSKYNWPINLMWNKELNKVYNELKNRKDIVMVGIDRTPAYDADEVARTQTRIQAITEFVNKEGYQFPVLVDKYHYDPRNSGHCYFITSDTYSAGSIGQFYILDRKGLVRYRSYPVSNKTTATSFTRELKAALKYAGLNF
ncbi:peroxiredoxin family protein [Pedobacter sp. PWIIR3]